MGRVSFYYIAQRLTLRVNLLTSWCALQAGEYYPINLLKNPFNLSRPLEIIDEHTPDGKHMLLYDVRSMTWSDPLQQKLFSEQ